MEIKKVVDEAPTPERQAVYEAIIPQEPRRMRFTIEQLDSRIAVLQAQIAEVTKQKNDALALDNKEV